MFLESGGPAVITPVRGARGSSGSDGGAGHLLPGGLPTEPATPGQGLLKVTLFPGLRESDR